MEDRIIELAGAGVPQSVIAQTVGCDPSFVSQILSQEAVQEKVAQLRLAKASGMLKHDDDITDLEKTALGKIGALLPHQTDLMKVTKVFQVLNAARKSSDIGLVGAGQAPSTVVNLNMPAAAMVEFKLTADRQVIEIAGRSMTPLPSHQVAAQLRRLQADRLLELPAPGKSVPTMSVKTQSIVDSL